MTTATRAVYAHVLNVLEDVQCELSQPEVVEFTSMALDRKVEEAIAILHRELESGEE